MNVAKNHQFLDDRGAQELINVMLQVSEEQFTNRIVNEINENSDDKHIVSNIVLLPFVNEMDSGLKLTNDKMSALKQKIDECSLLTHLHIEIYIGDLSNITNPLQNIIYFHKNSDDDNTWDICIYQNEWLIIGNDNSIEIDTSEYWTKDDIPIMRELLELFNIISSNIIEDKVISAFNDIIK